MAVLWTLLLAALSKDAHLEGALLGVLTSLPWLVYGWFCVWLCSPPRTIPTWLIDLLGLGHVVMLLVTFVLTFLLTFSPH
jgi:cyanate permease